MTDPESLKLLADRALAFAQKLIDAEREATGPPPSNARLRKDGCWDVTGSGPSSKTRWHRKDVR